MGKTYIKTIIREIKQSFGRFFAIFAIVALGVGFLAGLLASTPNMKLSVDQYYELNNMADIFIKSTLGLTDDDFQAVSKIKEVEHIMPAYVTDALMKSGNREIFTTRIYGLPLETIESKDDKFINKVELIAGRMPKTKNECLVERSGPYISGIEIGTNLTIIEEDDKKDELDDTYENTEFTVVGIVANPFYFSNEREVSSKGDGKLSAIVYVNEDNYGLDVYTDFYIRLLKDDNMQSFTDEYEDYAKEIVKKIEKIAKTRTRFRYGDVLDEANDKLNRAKDDYDEAKNEAYKELDKAYRELEDAKKDINIAEKELSDTKNMLTYSQMGLVNQAESELRKAKEDLISGEIKYKNSKKNIEQELYEADLKISEAEEKIEDIKDAKWYVLDRNSNVSYASFAANVEKVGAIAKVFPVFFLLVAALVALTTMTRMVDEGRTQIGTLKALGYNNAVIMSKYIIYCGIASLFGSIFGLITGFRILPNLIWSTYANMYNLPVLINKFSWEFAIIASSLAIASTMAATISAASHALKEKPATLMLPRAPKAGKRIFLENITFIWSRMKFTYKATARNLIRYKKHFFMTVIGISGCTALIVAGFGIRDSISDIANTQFNEILKYDFTVELDKGDENDKVLGEFLNNKKKVKDYMELFSEEGEISYGDEYFATKIVVPKDSQKLKKFIALRNRKDKMPLSFDESSVIVTEKLAESLGIRVGDTFVLENSDDEKAMFTLTGITENYVGSYAYINKTDYTKAFKEDLSYDSLLIKTLINSDMEKDTTITRILASDTALRAEFNSQAKETYDNLLESINFIVVVLILAAGGLAIIVLYNLTNINIEERKKELATLKVLGFHNKEVAAYIYRETTILSIIGTGLGLVLGAWLHNFIVKIGESVDLMFGRDISNYSFALSAIITLVFTIIVDVIMYRKLKNIEMVDSMKAVD